MILTRRLQEKLCRLVDLLAQEPEDRDAVDAVLQEIRALAKAGLALESVGRKLHQMARLSITDLG